MGGFLRSIVVTGVVAVTASVSLAAQSGDSAGALNPRRLPRVGAIDPRFQSFNIEMVEVTGGRFWKPYASISKADTPSGNQPSGMDASLYEYRPPIDLSNARLRKLAAALGPAYLRVSGTWANTTWFQDTDAPPPAAPPAGFKGILTRQQWKGIVDFSNAVGAPIVTSFAVSDGTRDANGAWTSDQAGKLIAFTRSSGGTIAAAEFMNEPTIPEIGGAPKGYDAAAYARDVTTFRKFLKRASPSTLLLGPGSVAEGSAMMPSSMRLLKSEDLLAATGPIFDAFSYHSYGGVSGRCGRPGMPGSVAAENALSADWLGRSGEIEKYYSAIRDRYEPGKPIWLTETAEAACGGDRWAATFLDVFRYLNQLGLLARRGVQVHMHNTLAASDYGLLDEKTYEPRPDYWAALLWHKLMGATVLDAGAAPEPNLHIYAHCLPGRPGGVSILAINADSHSTHQLSLTAAAQRYTLAAPELESTQVTLNGVELKLQSNDDLPALSGIPVKAGSVELPPATVTFLAVPIADNPACRE